MSKHIIASGNLAAAPELREGEHGPYTYARVLVTDRIRNGADWIDGPVTAYELAINGRRATCFVDAAQRSGNIRVLFAGTLTTEAWKSEDGSKSGINHKVRVDQLGIDLAGQNITVERKSSTEAVENDEPWGAEQPEL